MLLYKETHMHINKNMRSRHTKTCGYFLFCMPNFDVGNCNWQKISFYTYACSRLDSNSTTFYDCMFMLYYNYINISDNISKSSISTWLETRSSRSFPLTSSTTASLCDEFVPSWSQPVNGLYDGYLWPWPQWVDESDPCVRLCFRDMKPNSGWDWSMSGHCGDKARGTR